MDSSPLDPDYDARGNLTDDGTYDYVYDAENRLVEIKEGQTTLLAITYGPLGLRVASTDENDVTTRHIYDGLNTIAEYEDSDFDPNAPVREFAHGDDFPEPLIMFRLTDANGEPFEEAKAYYLHPDILGSIILVTDANDSSSENVVERYAYDPYGATFRIDANGDPMLDANGALIRTSSVGNPFRFTGQRYDEGVNLYHFPFRSLHPDLGRWFQRDPLGYVGSLGYDVDVLKHSRSEMDESLVGANRVAGMLNVQTQWHDPSPEQFIQAGLRGYGLMNPPGIIGTLNLYEYGYSTPMMIVDPMGLGFWDGNNRFHNWVARGFWMNRYNPANKRLAVMGNAEACAWVGGYTAAGTAATYYGGRYGLKKLRPIIRFESHQLPGYRNYGKVFHMNIGKKHIILSPRVWWGRIRAYYGR